MPLLEHLRGVRKLGLLILMPVGTILWRRASTMLSAMPATIGSPAACRSSRSPSRILSLPTPRSTVRFLRWRAKQRYFMEALLEHVAEPGLEVGMLFRKVRDGVLKRSAVQPISSSHGPTVRFPANRSILCLKPASFLRKVFRKGNRRRIRSRTSNPAARKHRRSHAMRECSRDCPLRAGYRQGRA